MKIYAISDLHGNLPPDVPPCDVLIIAGDICPDPPDYSEHLDITSQLQWLDTTFRAWLLRQPAAHIIGVAGNHDFVFERNALGTRELFLPWLYLLDESIDIDGVKFHGTPWIPKLRTWAFFADARKLSLVYENIEDDTDVVISHGPPLAMLDYTVGGVHAGAAQANAMLTRVKPPAFICGHIHEAHGVTENTWTRLYNVSYVDEYYVPQHIYVEIHLD